MSQEFTTPDLVELTRGAFEAADRGDFDVLLSLWGPDPVWDMSPMGLGLYRGPMAIHRFFEDWRGSYDEYVTEVEQVLDLDNEITFAVFIQKGRPTGSTGHVRIRYAAVLTWADGKVVRVTVYTDTDEARAAAERLAESRG